MWASTVRTEMPSRWAISLWERSSSRDILKIWRPVYSQFQQQRDFVADNGIGVRLVVKHCAYQVHIRVGDLRSDVVAVAQMAEGLILCHFEDIAVNVGIIGPHFGFGPKLGENLLGNVFGVVG